LPDVLRASEAGRNSETTGFHDPIVQVQNARTREVVYTLRVNGDSFTPLLREPGTYTVLAYDPDGGYFQSWPGVEARKRQTGS
jgi:hypothetical protein